MPNKIFYFTVIDHHARLFPDHKFVNMWQLMHCVGSEVAGKKVQLEDYVETLPLDCISWITLREAIRATKPMNLTEDMKNHYKWIELRNSIQEHGLKIPLIVERKSGKNRDEYIVWEGKHRVAACTLLEPFNAEYKVPCLLIERNDAQTELMIGQKHINPLSSSGVYNDGFIVPTK